MLDIKKIKQDFPVLKQEINGHSLCYLDSGASSQLPQQVLDAMVHYYSYSHANVHRGVHTLAERATSAYEETRDKVAQFIGAAEAETIVFTRGSTEALNLVAYSYAASRLSAGDGIITTRLEHHSNLVPWQQVAASTGCSLNMVDLTEDGNLQLDQYQAFLDQGNIKICAFAHASNVVGSIAPAKEMIARAHAAGAVVVLDAAQSVPHMPVNVQDLDVDFLAVSGHKMLAPTGIGFLYGKRELLEDMEPYQTGGSMIGFVEPESSTWAAVPTRFEAGTPNIVGAVGLSAAIDYLERLGMDNIMEHERQLADYAWQRLSEVDGTQLYGPRSPRAGLISFNVGHLHPHDVSTVLDSEGIAIRAGHHCAQPLHKWLNVAATNRASFYVYNDEEDIDRLVAGLAKVKEMFEDVTF
ncbi:MAG: cysteine desulfurase [Bacilli bacterium]|nr:cysteine desulfurase [Bacilli bacterium]